MQIIVTPGFTFRQWTALLCLFAILALGSCAEGIATGIRQETAYE